MEYARGLATAEHVDRSVLMIAGLGLQAATHASLGANWSSYVETKISQKLVMHGVYTYVRHPRYSAFVLFAVGYLFTCANWLVGLSICAVVGHTCLRIPIEEAILAAHFPQYASYRERSGALLPPSVEEPAAVAATVAAAGVLCYTLIAFARSGNERTRAIERKKQYIPPRESSHTSTGAEPPARLEKNLKSKNT